MMGSTPMPQAAAGPWPTYQAGEIIPLFGGSLSPGAGANGMGNQIRLVPLILAKSLSLAQLGSRLITLGIAGGKARFCIYNADPASKKATTLVGYTSDIATDGSGGNLHQTIAGGGVISLTSNVMYLAGIHASDNTQQWMALAGGDPYFQSLKPPTVWDGFNPAQNTGDMGQQLTYSAQAFGSVPPADLTAVAPAQGSGGGSAMLPAVWGQVA